jgi:metalloendopeptidase OMA1, mitochondrial
MKRFILALIVCVGTSAQAQTIIEPILTRTDTQKEIELGQQVYRHFLDTEDLSRNEAYIRRVNRVFGQLVAALPEKVYPFQVMVLANNSVNAVCAPGGFVAVYEGLLTKLPDDDQLATVLAHELGHAVRRHNSRRWRKMQTQLAKQLIVSILLGTRINDSQLGSDFVGFTYDHECEADDFGAELYLRAGFEPKNIANAMRTFAEMEKGLPKKPIYQRDHPETARRVASLEARRDKLIAGGLKPIDVSAPNLTVESVFGKIPTIAPQPCSWMTTEPGTTWQYEVSGSTGGRSSYVIKAVGLATVNSTPVVRMELDMGSKPVPYQMILDGNRIWRRNRPADQKSVWTLEAVMPEVGESEGDEKRAFAAVAAEAVDVPAGKFENCLFVKQRDGDRILHCWYAKGVGLVKRVNPASGVTEVLISHKRP